MGYTSTVIKGVSWIAILRASTRVIAVIKTVILARILDPLQYGAFGVALLVVGFLEVMTETGVNVILIQEKESDSFINSAWLVSIIRGVVIMMIIIMLTPLIARFFNSPRSLPLLYMISVVPLLRGFINPSVVTFQKNLEFKKEFIYRFVIFAVDSFVAITITVITKNPIGIIWGLISGVVLEIILSFVFIKPLPSLQFNKDYMVKILHRGKWLTASGVFNYLFQNTDNIVVGKILGPLSLGTYQMAYSFSILPVTEITEVFSKVTFPIYAKIASDKIRLRNAFLKIQLVITILSIPFGVLLFFFSKEIIMLLLGEKWIEASTILPILGIFAVIRAISGSISSLFLAVGKQEYVTYVTLASILGLFLPIIPLVNNFGIKGAAIAALIGTLCTLPIFLYFCIKSLR